MKEKQYFSTTEVAKLLGVSRIAVFKKIKSGVITAQKIGRNLFVHKSDLPVVLGEILNEENKRSIEASVKRTIRDYGDALKLLGKE